MQIKLVDGLHLTGADKRDIAAIIGNGWKYGETKQKRYRLCALPITGGNYWRYAIIKRETDSRGRRLDRETRGIITVKG